VDYRKLHIVLLVVVTALPLLTVARGWSQPAQQQDVGEVLREASEPSPATPSQAAPGSQKWALLISLVPLFALGIILYLLRWFGRREQQMLARQGGADDGNRDADSRDST